MLAMFAEAFEDRDSYLGNPPSDTDRAEFLTTPRVIALAAMDGDQFVGGLVAYQLDEREQVRSEI
jgi:aminoglycoside 3-N-acetyltransferase I